MGVDYATGGVTLSVPGVTVGKGPKAVEVIAALEGG